MLRSTLFLVGVFSMVFGACPEGCDHPVAIYEDLQCVPIYAKPGDCCPIKYDCSNIANRPQGKCTFKGEIYNIRQEIPKQETYGNCKIGCRCESTDQIECAILDCPEWLGVRPKSGNYYTYTLNHCCATGQRSAPFDTCKVGENTYKEGERFPGNLRCMECVCGKGWAGKYTDPFCMKQTCIEEMKSLDKINKNCAPTYFNVNTACCPFNWMCPDDKVDKITPASKKSDNQEQCKYGTKLFKVGDKLERIEPIFSGNHFEIKCECQIPPFLTCERKQIFTTGK